MRITLIAKRIPCRHYCIARGKKDKKDQPIELLKVTTCGDNDQYLWVCSQAKALKEKSMNGLLSQRFEEGIQSIQEGIAKKGGTK